MKISFKTLSTIFLAHLQVVAFILTPAFAATQAPYLKVSDVRADNVTPPSYLSLGINDVSKKQPIQWPEYFINPAVNYGLNMVLPEAMRKGLEFNAGYDRWEGLPTLHADYFLPIKGWSDKSLFVAPKLSLTGGRESFSLGAGFRHLITSDLLIGFHTFHDWVRPRRYKGEFLKQAGVGLEVSALPGYHSDISLRLNAYFPLNQRRTIDRDFTVLMEEVLPRGGDVAAGILFPEISSSFDFRLEVRAHSYKAENTNVAGYTLGLSVNSRNGMLRGGVVQGNDNSFGNYFTVDGGLNLAFDWVELFKGNNPFSAPYPTLPVRYDRRIADSLYDRVVRKTDLTPDRSERPIALAAVVSGDTVSFRGIFPDLPNSKVTVQISRSPWQDFSEVITDAKGSYSGRLALRPGKCLIRLIHKPTGRVSESRSILVGDPNPE